MTQHNCYNRFMEERHVERKKPDVLQRILRSYRKIPDKKPYIEFITAILSIPVLLTVIILNLNTLRGEKKDTPPTNTTPQTVVITAPESNTVETTPQEECIKEVGPISITSPDDGEVITDNPVFVSISYKQGEYCSVVWSYRINGGKWSDYDDRSIALYNPPPGSIKFELRVKSVVGNDSSTLTRNFVYQGTNIIQTTPTASSSAN
jgi:hypothetical protein